MRSLLGALATFVFVTTSFAGERFSAATWKTVQTYDVPILLKQEASLIGKVVAVRFHCRSAKLRHLHPNWYEAALWQHDSQAKNGFSALRVMIAEKDVPGFERITADLNSGAEVTVYGRIEKDPDDNIAYMRVLGRKARIDRTGNADVDW